MLHQANPANPFACARFTISCAKLEQLPAPDLPEVAFAGRSNAGKSSALNTLVGHRQLARVSKTPGRTQLINYFEVERLGWLVDLPGYGFAKVPEPIRRSWGALVGGYVETRENLRGLVVMMDIRHPLTSLDLQMLSWCRSSARHCHVLLTKADKFGFGAAKNQLQKVQSALKKLPEPATVQLYSSVTRQGVEEAREMVRRWLSSDSDAERAGANAARK